MVSLRRDTNSLAGGGTFFGNSDPHESDVQCLLQPVVGQEKSRKFAPLKTVAAAFVLLIMAIGIEIIVLSFALLWDNEEKRCEPYFVTLYIHVIYWAFSFVLDFYFKRMHHESRLRGYLEFYQKSKYHSEIPFLIVSIWNAFILLVETLFRDQFHEFLSDCSSHGFEMSMNYICFIITLENVFMVPILISYIYKVMVFNASKELPDVQRDEWMSSFVQDSYSSEVGYREQDDQIEDLLEKQADLLRYYKEQNSRLVKKVLILNNLIKAQTESLQC